MFDRAQWFSAGMSMALSVQLSQPVAAAVPVGKVVQTVQTNSNEAAKKVFEEAEKLYQPGTADSKRSAIVKFEQALKLYRETGDRTQEAVTLNNIGAIYSNWGEPQKALEYYSQSLPLRRAVGDRRGEAATLTNIGSAYSKLGEQRKALEYFGQSLPLSRAMGDRFEEAVTLYSMAYVKREQNNLTEALNDIESSLKIIENLRTTTSSSELPSSYFAKVQEYYKFYVDLLMQLHQANPNSGYDIKASEASERAKTR